MKLVFLVLVVTILVTVNFFNWQNYLAEHQVSNLRKGSGNPDQIVVAKTLYPNPALLYELALMTDSDRQKEKLLLRAIQLSPAWTGLHIA
ncbi:hypothetical protein ACFL27_24940, partial [candidate division CSSED10-310 bacterium]